MAIEHLFAFPIQQLGALVDELGSAARRNSRYKEVPPLTFSAGLIGEALLDRTFTLATSVLTGVPGPESVRQMVGEATEARAYYRRNGWLEDPRGYHRTPGPVLDDCDSREISGWDGVRRRNFQQLRFESAYVPHPEEPARERWLDNDANATVHVDLLEHAGEERPWLICVHGFGMGTSLANFSGFQARRLHEEAGLNLAFPCLPLHGPRSSARFSGGEILAPDYLNLVHLFAQGVSDVRRTISWARERGARRIGLYGISLGGYIAALVASLEEDLECVITGIPVVDFTNVARDNEPWIMRRYDEAFEVDWQIIRELTHVVSPLALEPRVPRDRRFIYAGIADRVVKPDQARALWRHWERPEIHWFSGGHVLGSWKRSVGDFVCDSLLRAGMTPASQDA